MSRARIGMALLLAGTAALAAACGPRMPPGVDRKAVNRVVGEVMGSQARLGDADRMAALKELELFLLSTTHHSERVARTLSQLADLYLKTELETYAREVARHEAQGAPGLPPPELRHDHSISLYRKVLEEYPDRPGNHEVLYQLARAYDDLGDTGAEARTLETLLQRHPSSPHDLEAAYRLGEIAFDQGRYNAAVGYYERVLKAKPGGALADFAGYKRVWAHYLNGDLKGASRLAVEYLDARRVERDGTRVLISQAMPELEWERVREVIGLLGTALYEQGGTARIPALFGGDRDYLHLVYRRVGSVAWQRSDLKGAIAAYEDFLRRYPDAPEAPEFLGYMVDRYTEAQQLGPSIAVRERLVTHYAPGTPWWKKQSAATRRAMTPMIRETVHGMALHYHSVAQESGEEADYDRAVAWYRKYLQDFTKSRDAGEMAFLLGEALFELGDYAEAGRAYRTSAYEAPPHARAGEAAYAAVYAAEKQLEREKPGTPARQRALEDLADSLNRMIASHPQDPRLPEAFDRVTAHLFNAKAFDLLYRVSDQMARLGPRSGPLQARAWRVVGEAALETGRPAEAEEALRNALELAADDPALRQELSRMVAAAAVARATAPGVEDAEAARALQEAAGLVDASDPLAQGARVDAGLALMRAGRPAEALEAFGAFVRDYPESGHADTVARAVIGIAEQAVDAGDLTLAGDAWGRYREWFGGTWPERDRALALLEGRAYLEAGDLEAADRLFTARLAAYKGEEPPEELVDRVAGIRFKRAAALLESDRRRGLALLDSIAAELPGSALAPQALGAVVEAARGDDPETAVAAARRLLERYPGSDPARAVEGRLPDLLVAAGRDTEAADLLVERAGYAPDDQAPAQLERAARLYEEARDIPGAVAALTALRDRSDLGEDPWVAAQLRMVRLEVLGRSDLPERLPEAKRTALDDRILEVLEPLNGSDLLGPAGRELAGGIRLKRAEEARARYDAVRLEPPLKEALERKRAALKEALDQFAAARAFRSRDVTLNATRQMGEVLEAFGRAVLDAPVPPELTGEQVAFYRTAVEKRARPYLSRAVQAHEENLKRLREGEAGPDVEASLRALARLRPEWYDRPEIGMKPLDVP